MLICDLLSKENISKYECDGLIINSKEYSIFNDKTFSLEEFDILVNEIHSLNKKAILSIDRIIEEFELEEFRSYLNKVFDIDFDCYVYSDLSILNYVIEHKLNVELIYDSKTMVTNLQDCLFYKSLFNKFNLNSNIYPMISNELTLKDVCLNSNALNTAYVLYGYHQIFYSRRLIFTSYSNYKKMMSKDQIELKLEDKLLHVKEEFRNELYPIYQSQFGTFVYNAKKFCCFKEIDELKNVSIFKINGAFIPEKELLEVVSIYKKLLCDGYSKSLEESLIKLDSNITTGFLYQESILLKDGEK